MYYVVYAHIIQAEREREIEDAMRRRQLLQRHDRTAETTETTETTEPRDRRAGDSRGLTPRVRPTGG